MQSQSKEGGDDVIHDHNGHISINGFKGIWTLNEIITLLQDHGLKVRVVLAQKGDDRELNEMTPLISESRR